MRYLSRRSLSLLLFLLLLTGAGCAMLTPGNNNPAISFGQQQAEIKKLVPKETSREAAIQRLEANGISGSYGVSDSIYYCDTWERPDGAVWPLSIALLFNEEGKVYDYAKETP